MAKIQIQVHINTELGWSSAEIETTENEVEKIQDEISDCLRGDRLAFVFRCAKGSTVIIPSEVLRKSVINIINI